MVNLKLEHSIVIPVYNEVESILELAAEIEGAMKELTTEYELIFIDDGSNDGSYDKIKFLSEKVTTVKIFQTLLITTLWV